MVSSTLPTIVFGPGAWHQPSFFDIVRAELTSHGYESEAVAYPSVGAEPPNKGLRDDAAALRSALERLADQGKEIVLAVHSYGGLVGQNAVEGLGYKQRAKAGKAGGVIMFVYITAFVNKKGLSLLDQLGNKWLPWMIPAEVGCWSFSSGSELQSSVCLEVSTNLLSQIVGDMGCESGYMTISKPEDGMYHDVEPELKKKAIADLKHQSTPVFSGRATYEPWHEIDCTYFFCELDAAIPIFIQEQMAQQLPEKTLKFRSNSSHSPFLSKPQDVVGALLEAAATGQERVRA